MRTKKELREQFILLRKSLRGDLRDKASNQIAQRLFIEPIFNACHTLQIYIAKQFEVQTEQIVLCAWLLKKRVVVPAFLENNQVVLSEWAENGERVAGPFGIRMPLHVRAVDPCEVDLWIVPGVAFDTQGNRLGFGGGVFDRLLKGTRGFKVGLAFDFQVVDALPADKTDQPIDQIITEKRTIRCSRR